MRGDLKDSPKGRKLSWAALVLLCVFIAGYVVYDRGGTANAATHLMYIPIVVASFCFGKTGAFITALLGGLILGPWMPADTAQGVMQTPANWIFRTTLFMAVGMVTALLFEHMNRVNKKELERSFIHSITGRPNEKKLKMRLTQMMDEGIPFSLIGFRVTNLDDINRYADYEIGIEAMKKAMDLLEDYVGCPVYSVFINEFAAAVPLSKGLDADAAGCAFLHAMKQPFAVDKFKVDLMLRGGIVSYPRDARDNAEMVRKMGMSLGEGADGPSLVVYDDSMEKKSRERYELSVALFDAIRNHEFHLVYQPQLCLRDGSVTRYEALLRWIHPVRGAISPETFIKMAEEIGLIHEITKWVMVHAAEQLKKWKQAGMDVEVAINVSSKDLRNCLIMDYLKAVMEVNGLAPSAMEIEITERSVFSDMEAIGQCLEELKGWGGKIALDDFGTGYNSLLNLITIPADYLKIDKKFVDDLFNPANAAVLESVIFFAHKTGKKVIAEGVETGRQLERLRLLGCDYVQGYYVSRPLVPLLAGELYCPKGRATEEKAKSQV